MSTSWLTLGRCGILFLLLAGTALVGPGCNDGGDSPGSSFDIGDNNPDVYVALGDSITQGTPGGGAPYPSRLAGIKGKTVVNAGSGGATSSFGASRVNGVLSQYHPARLLILFGANDAIHGINPDQVEANLRAIVAAAKANQTLPVIGTVTPMYDSHGVFQGNVNAINERIRGIASSEGIPLANLAGEFSGQPDLIQGDGLHPTDVGNQTITFAFSDKV